MMDVVFIIMLQPFQQTLPANKMIEVVFIIMC